MNDEQLYDKASIFARWEEQEIQLMTPEEEKEFIKKIKKQRKDRKNLIKKLTGKKDT